MVTRRALEGAAGGAFRLPDERSLMGELFSPGEMATCSSFEGLKERIRQFAARPGERRQMAARARERVLSDHTYAARMQTLLQFAKDRLPGFGTRKAVDWPDNMPESMRRSVDSLMRELNLPAGASFDDVIGAVRQKSDKLSDAEAALLFLDEWKKLYTR